MTPPKKTPAKKPATKKRAKPKAGAKKTAKKPQADTPQRKPRGTSSDKRDLPAISHPELNKLPPKQRAFVIALVSQLPGRNGAKAARIAGYTADSSHVTAAQLLAKPNIKKIYDELAAPVLEAMKMDAQEAIVRTAEMARADMHDFIENVETVTVKVGEDSNGNPLYESKYVMTLKPFKEMNGRLIKKISFDSRGMPQFELHDAAGALDKINRIHGLYDKEQDGSSLIELLAYVQRRTRERIKDAEFEEIDDKSESVSRETGEDNE